MIIDTHAHLYWESFQPDLEDVEKRAKDAGVGYVINIGTDPETSQKALEMESDTLRLFSTIGIHPEDAEKFTTTESIQKNIGELEDLYQKYPEKIVGIGECGLDFAFNKEFTPSPLSEEEQKRIQKELFKAQIALSKKLNLPLTIHCRDAWSEIFIPQLEDTKGVFHHFSSTFEDAQKALGLGYYLSFSCVVTYPKNEPLRELIKTIPLDKILTETDCPFLPPQTMRGQRNEPANVLEVVKVIAQAKGISFKEAAEITFQNAQTLFSLH